MPPTPWEQIPELLQVNPERKASGRLWRAGGGGGGVCYLGPMVRHGLKGAV